MRRFVLTLFTAGHRDKLAVDGWKPLVLADIMRSVIEDSQDEESRWKKASVRQLY